MKLKEWMKKNKKSFREVGKALGLHHTSIYKYYHGIRTPKLKNVQKIEVYTKGKVKAKDFF